MLTALTVLLMSLMVLVTLQIGQAYKTRMEGQVLADTAAYNQAVSTARAYNQVALLNRASAATWVSLAATQSLISWSGTALRYSMAPGQFFFLSQKNMDKLKDTACADPNLPVEIPPVWEQRYKQYEALDEKAAAQAVQDQGKAAAFGGQALSILQTVQSGAFGSFNATQNVLNIAGAGPQFGAGYGDDANPQNTEDVRHPLFAVMGTRGDPFITNRSPPPVQIILPPDSTFTLTPTTSPGGGGGAGFGSPGEGMGSVGPFPPVPNARHRAQTWSGVNGTVSWAEDDGNGTLDMHFTCPLDGQSFELLWSQLPTTAPLPVDSYVASTDQNDDQDQHHIADLPPTWMHQMAISKVHTLYCVDTPGNTPCHGIFGGFAGFDEASVATPYGAGMVFGQPVMSTLIRIKPVLSTKPWDKSFHWFNSSDQFSTQTGKVDEAVTSSSVAYYHRTGHLREPPNFFNPFWRATLVSGWLMKNTSTLMGKNGFPDQEQIVNALGPNFRGY